MTKKLLILSFILFCVSVFSQEHIRYTTKQGLPSNYIYDIAEDSDGFMWFATNRGLVKFNGDSFKTFTIKDGLPNNDTWLLESDLQNRLWYFSKSNFQGFIKKDSIYKFPTEYNEVITPAYTFKSKDSLWFLSGSGLQTVNANQIKSSSLYNIDSYPNYMKKIDSLGRKFGFSTLLVRIVFNPISKEFVIIKQNELVFFDWNYKLINQTNFLFPNPLSNDKIFVSGLLYNQIGYYALDKGILFIDFKTKQSKHIEYKDVFQKKDIKHLRCRAVYDGIQVSVPGHLLLLDYNLNITNTYSFPEAKSNRTSYKDSQGNIWLADFISAISFISNSQVQANYYLKNKSVKKIEKLDKTLFAGVDFEGFFSLDSPRNLFIHGANESNITSIISHIKKDPSTENAFLISGSKSYRYNNNVLTPVIFGKMKAYKDDNPSHFKDLVYYKNKLFGITAQSLLVKENNQTKFLLYKTGMSRTAVYNDKLFVGGSDGLHVLINDSLLKPNHKSELLKVSITSFMTTKKGLLVGTGGRGVYIYNNNQVIHLTHTDGLNIQRIRQKDNDLWLATQNGVQILSLDLNNLQASKITNAFYDSDGLLQNNTNDIYLQDSLLYVASDIGLARINLKNPVYKKKPQLYFKTFQDTISFKNEERDNISISFSTLNFVNQDYLKYEYRLLPTQKDWIETKTTTLNFNNLSPKKYTLQVKVRDQHHNESIEKIQVFVKPVWWETNIAKIGMVLGLLFLFILIDRKVRKRIRVKEEMKVEQNSRLVQLELQSLRSQMNPHFVHNSLNAIQYYIQRNEVELSEEYLVKFSKLIRLFFEYSRRQNISIKEEVSLLKNYLQIEQLRFEEKLKFDINIDQNIDTEEQEIPSMLLQPIVENAVNHGLFHKKGNGRIYIHFKNIHPNTIQVIIEDDGIGFNRAKEIFKSSAKNYQSRSSEVLRERLELLNRSKNWLIDYKLTDKEEMDKTNISLKEKTGSIAILKFIKMNEK